MIFKKTIVIAIAFWSSFCSADESSSIVDAELGVIHIRFHDQVSVVDKTINMADLIDVVGADRDFTAMTTKMIVAPSPSPGKKRVISRHRLSQLLKSLSHERSLQVQWPKRIQVQRRFQLIQAASLKKVLQRTLEKQISLTNAQVAIESIHFPNKHRLALGTMTFQIKPLVLSRTKMNIAVNVMIDKQKSYHFFANTTYSVTAPVVVSSRQLVHGSILSASDVEVRIESIKDLRHTPVQSITDVIGKQNVRFLSQNQILVHTDVRPPPLVRKGARVQLVIEGKGLAIKTIGYAEQDGYKDQWINIRTRKRKKQIRARVIRRNQVVVTL